MIDPPDLDSRVSGYRDHEPAWRRRLPGMVFAIALGVMTAAGLWIGSRWTAPAPAPTTVPILHADTRPLKVPPSQPGGMDVPDQDMMVLNQTQAPAQNVEQLLPPPETPLPRPVPEPPPPANQGNPAEPAPQPAMAPVAVVAPQRVIPSPASKPAQAAASPTVVEPPADLATAPEGDVPAPRAAKLPASAEPPAPAANPAPAASGGYRLQLGAVRSEEAARAEWERLKRAHADLLGSLGFTPWRVELGERGVYFRIMAGPIADAAQAERVCAELKALKLGCILVKP